MSTISPTESKAVGKLVIENDGKYIEAPPVSGSVGAATAGVLLILVGGNEADTKDL